MFGASCGRNCKHFLDQGKVVGRCRCKDSEFYNSPVRADFSCPCHPMIIRMLKETVSNWCDA